MVTQLIGGRNIIQAEVTEAPDPKALTPGIPLLLPSVARVQSGGGGLGQKAGAPSQEQRTPRI